jgi:hypothetical protein
LLFFDRTIGRRSKIVPGCVVPITTPEAHYRAVPEAVNAVA